MKDIILVLTVLGFFALTALFVVGCDKIIGPDEDHLEPSDDDDDDADDGVPARTGVGA